MRKGTPLQAIRFATGTFGIDSDRTQFLKLWLDDRLGEFPDDRVFDEYTEFCKLHPDEPERSDGRKVHYGMGRQPLDDIIDSGWGPQFCAGNVLKYLRRSKNPQDSRDKAAWYWRKLNELPESTTVTGRLMALLTHDELKFLLGRYK